ncbi:hypothetical protein [Shewanella gelidii]|uniref:Uncharacterized protein n=1 Tax=Shewanella gelidii TaxID=1642821 RepID=A0A917N8Q6_9GAMM|nr:hypothetical protein [Shewanella gelidii]MCL1096971.1 hypothetical protein [Shewanella gelidii]GGI71585.1 hypothetical protein GCM10009332_06180 [Shewanella gelidii]
MSVAKLNEINAKSATEDDKPRMSRNIEVKQTSDSLREDRRGRQTWQRAIQPTVNSESITPSRHRSDPILDRNTIKTPD